MVPRNPSPPLSFIRPLLPSLVAVPPEGDGWIHEVKHDGYRTIVVVEDGRARAFTRNGHDWTGRFARIATAATALPCRAVILDGETIVQNERGIRFRGITAAPIVGETPEIRGLGRGSGVRASEPTPERLGKYRGVRRSRPPPQGNFRSSGFAGSITGNDLRRTTPPLGLGRPPRGPRGVTW